MLENQIVVGVTLDFEDLRQTCGGVVVRANGLRDLERPTI